MSTLYINRVSQKLDVLHSDAKNDFMRMGKGIIKSMFRPMQPDDFKDAYLPISREQGKEISKIIIENNFKNVVEFGTSFGISTIYLADAVRTTDGKVITTELLESKAIKAKQNIDDVGLSDYVEIRIGDAMETLKTLSKPIDFLFLDGWKNLYLPLFQLLEPLFNKGTLIYADNMDMSDTHNYASYLLSKKNEYNTQSIQNGKVYLSKFL
ncbi:O-methyltransferase [uncultured Lacinutrix sp.]|uniref:O-methyltransferase n=1 Tax=uncultured Lacinutrix sp. TaxID=574032 RepID=UPI00262A0A14|nr:class I SAM-dependent methyltransferase [uncultured Lacinutrix sp.]